MGPIPKGGGSSKSRRSGQGAASARVGASSRKMSDEDDDFMPSKRGQNRSKDFADQRRMEVALRK